MNNAVYNHVTESGCSIYDLQGKNLPVQCVSLYSLDLENQFPDCYGMSPLDFAEELNESEVVAGVLNGLSPVEREVLEMRFGFCGMEYTLDVIAGYFDLTRERVRQIQAKALAKLKRQREILLQL